MFREEVAKCKEGKDESLKDIQDDWKPEPRQINGKRVDEEWGPWETVVTETAEEYKEVLIREIQVDWAHGGIVGNSTSKIEQYWLRLVLESTDFFTAKYNCEALGGKLFSDVDGTAEQLEFLAGRMGYRRHWLGIYRKHDADEDWIDTKGNVIPGTMLRWDTDPAMGEPDLGDNRFVINYVNSFGDPRHLHDVAISAPSRPSICDMRT